VLVGRDLQADLDAVPLVAPRRSDSCECPE